MGAADQRTILYLEDQPDLLAGWSSLLTLAGFAVRPCRTLDEAFAALEVGDITLVLCDFQLEMGTSLPLIEAARRRQPPLTVVLMTGNRERAEAELAAVGLALPILAKPATLDNVMLALASG